LVVNHGGFVLDGCDMSGYIEDMPDHVFGPDLLNDLRARKEWHESELRAINAAITAIEQMGNSAPTSAPTTHPRARPAHPMPELSLESPYYGKGLGEAGRIALETHGEPLTTGEVVAKLRSSGFNFSSENPSSSVYWALRKRGTEHGDVLSISGSKWALPQWRDNPEQLASMRAGLNAARANGVRLGAPSKMTPEKTVLFDEMKARGADMNEIAKAVGMTPTGLRKWAWKRDMELKERQENPSV
jgi:hypothetical protein